MKARFALAAVVSVLLAACFLPKTDQSDGSSCASDDECKSKRCFQGFCSGSKCEKPGTSEGCDDGWTCVHRDPDPISGFFGSDGSDSCQPTCGHCPGSHHCKKDAPAGSLCEFGKAPLELSIVADDAVIGRPTELLAFAPNTAGELVECRWELGDGKPSETTQGPLLVRTFDDAREHSARVSCKDSAGASGFVETRIDVKCPASGDACVPTKCCANADDRCVTTAGASPTCRAPAPVVLEIEGPTAVEVNVEATWTVKAASGDGQVQTVYWSFSDQSIQSSRSGDATTTHDFSRPGNHTVTAKVTTDIQTEGQAQLAVTVCQRQNGRCDSPAGITCCGALTCQGSTSFKTCLP